VHEYPRKKQDRILMTSSGMEHAQRVRLFRSDALEQLTTISHRGFALIWAFALGFVLWMGWGTVDLAPAIALVVTGVASWTLFEYAMHRFIFHWNARWKAARAFVFVVHANHHEVPDDPGRSLMPPVVSIPVTGSVWLAFLAIFGPPGSLLFLGFASGYVIYDAVHHACHHFPMRGPVFRALRRHHLRHHHAREDGNFAITAIFWDKVFGTRILIKGR
jgi:sterol desaturase/sphingolipid hydroxylase (fatty acid hydroxylase superfamily)